LPIWCQGDYNSNVLADWHELFSVLWNQTTYSLKWRHDNFLGWSIQAVNSVRSAYESNDCIKRSLIYFLYFQVTISIPLFPGHSSDLFWRVNGLPNRKLSHPVGNSKPGVFSTTREFKCRPSIWHETNLTWGVNART